MAEADAFTLLDIGSLLLAVWREGLVSDQVVVSWADGVVMGNDSSDTPTWLLDLCAFGPARLMAGPSSEFITVPQLSFAQWFSLRGHALDLGNSKEVELFVSWVSRAAMGEDLESPEVRFAYHVEHLWGDCSRTDLACELVRAELPTLLISAANLPSELTALLRDTKRERG